MIPYGKHFISKDDIDAVVNVLKYQMITQGHVVPEFESAIAEYCHAKFAFAVTNATSALHLACMALGIGPGDWVWTSPNTFVSSSNCVLYCGAKIDFVDIDAQTYNLSIKKLQEKLESASKTGRLPKAVIAVHFSGQSCEMKELRALSRQYGFFIIEDASHAIGATYLDSRIGSCIYSDITVFSFHPVKIITTGEGGMLLTNNGELAEKIDLLRNHGITRNSNRMTEKTHGDWYYQQIELGYNYRMTDIQAALGLSQLQRLDEIVKRRREIAKLYNALLKDLPLTLPWQSPSCQSSWHLYVISLDLSIIKKSRKDIFESLRKEEIGVNVHYIPVHTQPYYQKLGFSWGDFPESENYYEKTITIPLFPEMTDHDIEQVNAALRKSLQC